MQSQFQFIRDAFSQHQLISCSPKRKANNLFPVLQSAYRQNHSTETALLKVKNDIFLNMDKGHVTLLVMLDLSAAFDTVDHGILFHRFSPSLAFGIRLYYGLNLIWREERSRTLLTERSLKI